MNPKNKHTIGLLVSDDLSISGKDVKESIKVLLDLFKDSVKIPEFLNKLTEKEFTASEVLEKVV